MQQMQQLKYQIRFVTPAFLGDANQDARWRTPPFKALLRQWWRVVWAAKGGNDPLDFKKMRREEGLLFGYVRPKDDRDMEGSAQKSQLRIRLDRWELGKLSKAAWGSKEVRPGEKIKHPEVRWPIGPLLYLGYGALEVPKGNKAYPTALKRNAAIQQDEEALLSVALPAEHSADIRMAIELISAYGAIGGRSRNGWGSMHLYPADSCGANVVSLERYRRPWRQALEARWPCAIGNDGRGALVWRTKRGHKDWVDVMRELASLKIAVRTQFKFGGNRHGRPDDRYWLAYPVTHHDVSSWKDRHLPNSLRFKVRREENGQLRGMVFHMPCLPPPGFKPSPSSIERVWKQVHQHLDQTTSLERISE